MADVVFVTNWIAGRTLTAKAYRGSGTLVDSDTMTPDGTITTRYSVTLNNILVGDDIAIWDSLVTTAPIAQMEYKPEVQADLIKVNGAAQTATLDTIKAETVLIVTDTNELQTNNVPGLIAALPTDADVKAACDTAISDAAIPAGVRTNLATELGRLDVAISTRNAVAPATPTNVTNAQTAIINALPVNDISAADVITALKVATGFTQGGTWTLAKLTKVLAAWSSGLWRSKIGVVGTYEVLDPDDGVTVIFEIIPLETSPQRTVDIKI